METSKQTKTGRKSSATSQSANPLINKMGAWCHNKGCTFRIWAPNASRVAVKVWPQKGRSYTIKMKADSAAGYGNQCWSVFAPNIELNDQYRFIIHLPNRLKPIEKVDAYGQSVVYPYWNSITKDDRDARSIVIDRNFEWHSDFIPPSWNEMVIYQLHIGTFYDTNTSDTPTISSIIDKLVYLKQIGINAIQLLPYTEFSSDFSMGYNSILPFAIESDYGNPQDFKQMIDACHSLDIAVFIDVIYNHIDVNTSIDTEGFYSLSTYDGWSSEQNPNGIYFYGGDEIRTPWAAPRPDYGRSEVCKYLCDNAILWLKEYKMDGIRFDSTKCIRIRQENCGEKCCGQDIGDGTRNYGWELMQYINREIDNEFDHKITIAEDLDNNDWITHDTEKGGAGFNSQWDSGFQSALQNALTQADDTYIDMEELALAINFKPGTPFTKRVIYLQSHGEAKTNRIATCIEPSNPEGWYARKKSMLGIGILMTSPGIPMIFQGTEFLENTKWSDQTPLNWRQAERFPRYKHFISDLINLRNGSDDNTSGLCGKNINIIQSNNFTKVIVFHRWGIGAGQDDVMVIANFSSATYHSYTIGLPYPGSWRIRLNSDANVYSDFNDFGSVNTNNCFACWESWDGMPYKADIAIGAFSIVILTK